MRNPVSRGHYTYAIPTDVVGASNVDVPVPVPTTLTVNQELRPNRRQRRRHKALAKKKP